MQMFIMSSSVLITIIIIWLSLGLFQYVPLLSEGYNRMIYLLNRWRMYWQGTLLSCD